MMLIILKFALLFALAGSLAGYLGKPSKIIELLSHFRAQYSFFLLGATGYLLWAREIEWAAFTMAGLVFNLTALLPWYIRRRDQSLPCTDSNVLKLVHANVNHTNVAHNRFLAFIHRSSPDIVIVQEVDEIWSEALRKLHDEYPYHEREIRVEGSGMALFSRFRFERAKAVLPEGEDRPCMLVKIDLNGISFWMLSIHPRAPLRPGHFDRRNHLLLAAEEHLKELPSPKICIGDLNTSLWSPYYRSFARQTGLKDTRYGFGLLPTWPSYLRFRMLMIPIDHCLVSDDIAILETSAGEHIDSDHFPLIVSLRIPKRKE